MALPNTPVLDDFNRAAEDPLSGGGNRLRGPCGCWFPPGMRAGRLLVDGVRVAASDLP